MHQPSLALQSCIEACLSCYRVCLDTAAGHCLEAGGKHVEPKHFRLMLSCVEICRTAAHFMLLGSEHHKRICRECADICERCAQSCDDIGDMTDCAEECRRCAESCRRMAA